ncbi:hypothetical protein C2869_19670 [Saccharobesus litoralis]|uniref:Transposase n=1 Tax=Saccharobesus litoralis TaxID=2172099 RepID=A0A2S0VPB4_9ALTE|nr:hypothetical protein [Saccharobesus litoralis]AWB66044.1 hypothetical protein C2869_06145 [Saccharobesus litoralis]AWB68482.1 hypothetical protein C2869_19670 [Saccharobesus litoralis]
MTTDKQAFWQTHIEQWQMSGLSQAAYCRQHNLSQNSLSYHKHKIGNPNPPCHVSTVTNGFARVQVMESYTTSEPLSVQLNNGLKVCGINHHNLELVKQLAQVLS